MATRKITCSLPADLIRNAKAYAAEHDTTVNNLVRELLAEVLSHESLARAAADRLLRRADREPDNSVR